MSMRSLKSKKGEELVGSTVIELLIAVACLFVIVGAGISWYNGRDTVRDDISEGYFEELERVIEEEGYLMMTDRDEGDLEFGLVYFGSAGSIRVSEEDNYFSSSEVGENVICVCSWDGNKGVCRHCVDMKKPGEKVGGLDFGMGEFWMIAGGSRVEVREEGGRYVFLVD